MIDPFPTSAASRGRISHGPTIALVDRTLEFVYGELAGWRDDSAIWAQQTKYLTWFTGETDSICRTDFATFLIFEYFAELVCFDH